MLLLQRGVIFQEFWMLFRFILFIHLPSDSLAIKDAYTMTASCWITALGKGWKTDAIKNSISLNLLYHQYRDSYAYVILLQRFITKLHIHEASQTSSFQCSVQCTSICATLFKVCKAATNIADYLLFPSNTAASLLSFLYSCRVMCIQDNHKKFMWFPLGSAYNVRSSSANILQNQCLNF